MSSAKRPLNILFLESGEGFGGSSNFLYYMLKYLDKKRFNPIVVFYHFTKGPYVQKIKSLDIEIIFLKGIKQSDNINPLEKTSIDTKLKAYIKFFIKLIKSDCLVSLKLWNIIRRKRISLLVLNNVAQNHIPGIISSRMARVPCICRKAGIGGGRFLDKFLGHFVDLYIACSEASAKDQIERNIPTKRLVTVYEGIDLERFSIHNNKGVKIRRDFNIPDGAKVVGCISRIDKGKGHPEFIIVASEVIKRRDDVFFLIVGDDIDFGGVLRRKLEEEVKRLGLDRRVIFTGWRTDIPDILSAIDIFVHCPTTWLEALGIATLEAMAMGKPTIVSNNWGLAETTANGVTGFVVPSGGSNSVVNALLRLLEDDELRLKMGMKARERAETLFNIETNVKKMEELFYLEVILSTQTTRIFLNAIEKMFAKLKKFIYFAIFYSGFVYILRIIYRKIYNNPIKILFSHKIIDSSDDLFPFLKALGYLTVEEFEKKIEYLLRHYKFISLGEALNYLREKRCSLANCIVLTFDDGNRSIYTRGFPILKKYDIPVTIFLTTDSIGDKEICWYDKVIYLLAKTTVSEFKIPNLTGKTYRTFSLLEKAEAYKEINKQLKQIEEAKKNVIIEEMFNILKVPKEEMYKSRYGMSFDELKELNRSGLVSFGSHTVSHPILTKIPLKKAEFEIYESKKILEENLGIPIRFFSYPNGDYGDFSEEIKEIVRDSGYICACTTIPDRSNGDCDIFALRREGFIHEPLCILGIRMAGIFRIPWRWQH